ncbi:MAG TPA: sigma-70 family RNA polymerase sigma factor [Mycobacteriales bacterium]
MDVPGDAELVARLRDRDEAAFVFVLEAWSPGMQRLARSFVSTPDSAAECVQDTWLAVIEGIDRFEGRAALRTWVYRILVNTAKRRGVREGRSVPWSSVADETGPTVDPARFRGPGEPFAGHWREFPARWPEPENATLAAELRQVVAEAIAELPERQRVVLTLRDIHGYDGAEVSSILEISPGYQRVLLHRARVHVRARIDVYHAKAETG